MKSRIYLVGGLNKTRSLAKSLINKGYTVTAINKNLDDCHQLAEVEGLAVFHGDGTKPFVLEDANIYNANIAIALTGRDDDNLVICELCKKRFNVKKTVALIFDQNKTEFFYKLGVDSVVCAISAITSIIEHHTFLESVATLIPIASEEVSVSQVPIIHSSPIIGKKLSEINLPKSAIIGCILRSSSTIVPKGNTQILAGDILMLISTGESELEAVKELTGLWNL